MSLHQLASYNLTDLDRQRIKAKDPKSNCAKLLALYLQGLKAVILPKVNTYLLSKAAEYLCQCDISVFPF